MAKIESLLSILFLSIALLFQSVHSKVLCNSTVADDPTQSDGVCEGDYCFNLDDKLTGCINTYRQLRDDNIACGHMHLLGDNRYVCVCTQSYCTKYETANMPTQVLAQVNCTVDDAIDPNGLCSPGPCYVGNDLWRYGKTPTQSPTQQRTCMQDWFAVTNFKDLIMYEVPPLAKHAACFFDDQQYNCMCKDPGCNAQNQPSMPVAETDSFFQCHKMECLIGQDPKCNDDDSLGMANDEMCTGQMCYYLKSVYDFNFNGAIYNESKIIRGCLNYSHENPIGDLTFFTGFEFGRSSSVFVPCREDLCNGMTPDTTTAEPVSTTTNPTDEPTTTTSVPTTTTSKKLGSITMASPILIVSSILTIMH